MKKAQEAVKHIPLSVPFVAAEPLKHSGDLLALCK